MQLREYMTSDCNQLERLFFQTVNSVNAKEYTKEYTKEQTVVRNGISLTNFIMEK